MPKEKLLYKSTEIKPNIIILDFPQESLYSIGGQDVSILPTNAVCSSEQPCMISTTHDSFWLMLRPLPDIYDDSHRPHV